MCVSFSDMAFLLAMDSGLVNPMAQSIECLTIVPEDQGSNPSRSRKCLRYMYYVVRGTDVCILCFIVFSLCVSVHQDYKDDTLALWRSHGVDAVICPGFPFPAIPHNSFGDLVGKDIFVL